MQMQAEEMVIGGRRDETRQLKHKRGWQETRVGGDSSATHLAVDLGRLVWVGGGVHCGWLCWLLVEL